jgi:2-polyprenyl-3-methyl-5-hydroxy-6-metoxy-1,4-benzoquinol methylase
MDAAKQWLDKVEAEEAQTNELRSDDRGDYWAPLTKRFVDDPRREGDPSVEALAKFVTPSSTVIDVGAGAGRIALPLALRCRKVIAVEPSAAMCEGLRETAREHGIDNVEVIQSTWEDAECEPADLVFAAHVVYFIRPIGEFVDKLSRMAKGTAAILLMQHAPVSQFDAWWHEVYGIERISLPALPELLPVLWERGIYPNVEMLPTYQPPPFKDEEEASNAMRHRLFIGKDNEQMLERLRRATDKLLVTVDGGVAVRDLPAHRPALVHWQPEAPSSD